MRYSENVASCRLSAGAQHIVSELGDTEMVRALSMNPTLDASAANNLLKRGGAVRMRALSFASDVEQVAAAARTGGLHGQWATRNPGLDPETLSGCLLSSSDATTLSALINVATPESARRSLSLRRIEGLVNVGGALANSVVRSFEVVLSNKWLRDYYADLSTNLRRGVTGLSDLSDDEIRKIESFRYSHWESHRLNPARGGCDISSMDTSSLVAAGSVACDVLALSRADLTRQHAELMLKRKNAPVEPHVLARIAKTFGADILRHASDMSVARSAGAAWLVPVVGYSDECGHEIPWGELQEAADTLGENQDAWLIYSKMRHSWNGDLRELAQAAACM